MGKTKDVRAAVEAELGFDPRIDVKNITVRNINGEVALNGTVPSYPQYLEAAAAARRVTGVTSVHNHLEVVLPPGDFRDDTMLTTAANVALERNITVPEGVEATAYDGDLTLTGTVAYGTERAAAESAVAGLDRCPPRHGRHRHQLRRRSGRCRPARPGGAGALRAGP